MILNHVRVPVWNWDGCESKCPMCGELLVARRCRDRVWHWAHKPHTDQKPGTCLFDDSEWALRWRLGYLMFPGWQIEVPKQVPIANLPPGRAIPPNRMVLLHAVNPTTRQVRMFVGHINEANEPIFQFHLGAQNHNVCWMFDGKEWVRALAKAVGRNNGYKEFLKPKAQALYERICKAGQNALVHWDNNLYREWVKTGAVGASGLPERTGIWFPLTGEKALAVLDNYSKVVLPYDNAKSEAPKAVGNFNKLMNAV